MAKLKSVFSFQGSLDNFSVYQMEGVDQPVVRRKGGASRGKILHEASFANTRRTMGEFGGRSAATRAILQAFAPLRPGHGTTGRINKVLTALQKRDTQNPWGRRSVALSLCPQLVQGLNISSRLLWDEIVKNLTTGRINRPQLKANIVLPPLLPEVTCQHPKSHPYYRVVAILGLVPDLFYNDQHKKYLPPEGFLPVSAQSVETPWIQTNCPTGAATLEVALPQAPTTGSCTLILSVAIKYGKLGPGSTIEPLPRAAAAKVITAG